MIRDRAGQWHRPPYDQPEARELRPFQRIGADWLMRPKAAHSLLADDMGLGKSAQVVAAINALPPSARVLIVCPAGLRQNWLRELAQWLTTTRRCEIVRRYIPDRAVVIVSVDALARFEVQIRSVAWDLAVLDEAHLIRNRWTLRARQVLGDDWTAPLEAARKIALTGTPMPNRPIEVWPILRWLGCPMPRREFGERFCAGGDFSGSSDQAGLRSLLGRYMLRRTKAEVLTELPPKTRQIVRIAPAGSARGCIAAEGEWCRQVESVEGYRGKAALGELTALRQSTALAKLALPEVRSIIREAAECYGKIVIFAAHHCAVDAVAGILAEAGIEAIRYTGLQSTEERQRCVDRFQRGEGRMALVATLGAGGVGITLTAASVVLFVEEDFTPGVIDQAEDRCHRYGQNRAVLARHIVLDGSYDARQLAIQAAKMEAIGACLAPTEAVSC